MDQHGGRVEILDAPGGGTVFRVELGRRLNLDGKIGLCRSRGSRFQENVGERLLLTERGQMPVRQHGCSSQPKQKFFRSAGSASAGLPWGATSALDVCKNYESDSFQDQPQMHPNVRFCLKLSLD